MAKDDQGAEFARGWQAALEAARHWHEAQAMQALVLSRRTRFPKNLERDAELHQRCAHVIAGLAPEDG